MNSTTATVTPEAEVVWDREAARKELRLIIVSGEQIKMSAMCEMLHLCQPSLQEIADEVEMPVCMVKKAIKPWWHWF